MISSRLFFYNFIFILFIGIAACQTKSSCYRSKVPEYDKDTPDGTYLPSLKKLSEKKRFLRRKFAHEPDMEKVPPLPKNNYRNHPDTTRQRFISERDIDNTVNYKPSDNNSESHYPAIDTLKN